MKTNKLLILALPLLLAISACNSTQSQSGQSSQDTSSEEPAPSRSEEPLPEKTPEEMEAEARESFSNASKMLRKSDYYVEGSLSNGLNYEPFIVVTDCYFTMSQRAALDDGTVSQSIQVGYMANAHGVFRLRSTWVGDFPYPVGYAVKTDSYAEAKEFVQEHTIRLELNLAKWEYVANAAGSANFKTTDIETINAVTTYLYGVEVSGKFSTIYANIGAAGTSLTISVDAELPGRPTFFTIRELDLSRYLRGVTRADDEGDWRSRQLANIISEWKDRDISDTEWEGYQRFSDMNCLPFPENANRYYFYDPYTDDQAAFENYNGVKTHIGFFDSGDLSSSYKTQLTDSGWTLDEGETSKFSYGNHHVTLRFVASSETVNPTRYAKGIFYLDLVTQW